MQQSKNGNHRRHEPGRTDRPGRTRAARVTRSGQGDQASGPLAGCTIVSRNYFSHARILAESFLRHEPDGRFYILVVDDLPDAPEADSGPGVTLVGIGDIGLRDPRGMCLKYDVVELNTAVKPAFLATLLYERGEEELVYLDPDIEVMRPLETVKAALTRADIVLTPHVLTPIPLDGLHPSDQDILISG